MIGWYWSFPWQLPRKVFEFNGPFLEKTQLWGEKLAFFFFNFCFTFKTFDRKLLSSLRIPAKFRGKMFLKNRKLTIFFLSRNFRRTELCVIHIKRKPVTAGRKRNSWVFLLASKTYNFAILTYKKNCFILSLPPEIRSQNSYNQLRLS